MLRGAPAALVAFATVVVLGGQNGGFLADTWGWIGLPLLLVVALAVGLEREPALSALEVALVVALTALTLWTALSAVWAPTAGPPIIEAERALIYVGAVTAVFVVGARRSPEHVVHGILAAAFVLCVWALGDKIFGHRLGRLEGPIGYANGMGLVAAIGTLLTLGLARRRPPALAALVVFAPTLVLTYSRGSWVALAAGVVVLVLLGVRLRPRTLFALGAAVALAVAVVLLFGHHGAAGQGSSRLGSLSGNGRGDYWRVALDEVRAHPALGGGAGTWGRWWLLRRPGTTGALDAHELYLETLAELGPFGLALLVAALALPFVALRHALRRRPDAAAWAAAYVALLVHAALDWDWELPAVTLCGLLCGAAIVAAADEQPRLRVRGIARGALLATALAGAAAVFVLQVGNSALAAASNALDASSLARATRDANRANDWQPWSTQPRLILGEAQLAAGNVGPAANIFRSLVRRDPTDWELWYQLALATSGEQRAGARARAAALNPHGPASSLP